jgi:hypothetical protein
VLIVFTVLLPLGLVVHAQLPGQLPGQKLPGQLPGPSSAPAKPAIAAPPSVGAALPGSPCCGITAINKATGIVTAREKSGNRTIEIKATPAQIQNLRVGQDLFANLETKQASLDGKTLCCGLTFATATPSPTFPAMTLSVAPVVPAGGSPQIGSSSSAAGTAPSPQPTPSPAPAGGKDSGPTTKPTVAGKGGSKNTDFPNVDTRTINASEGSTAQAIRGLTAASPPTPSAPQSPAKQFVPTKTASADSIKPSPSTLAAKPEPEGFGMSFDPATVTGGAKATGTITLSTRPPPSPLAVSLSSSEPGVLTVPVEVVIGAQKSSADFAVSTKPIATPTVVTVSASLAGHTRTATIHIAPAVSVAAVSLSSATVIGGSSVSGSVILTGSAASTGVTVTLASNQSVAIVPGSIQVAGGSSQGTFTIATKPTANSMPATIFAWTAGTGNTKTAQLVVTPNTTTTPTVTATLCASGLVAQAFSASMQGCSGHVAYGGRAILCAPSSHVCTANEFMANHGGSPPSHHYWTNDALRYNGVEGSCFVSTSSGATCAVGPMRVCTGTGTDVTDPEGNICNWTGCGLDTVPTSGSTAPNHYFGGCGYGLAGTLCCR